MHVATEETVLLRLTEEEYHLVLDGLKMVRGASAPGEEDYELADQLLKEKAT